MGRVIKPGKTITVAQGEAWAWNDGQRRLVAQMTGTLMAVFERAGIRG